MHFSELYAISTGETDFSSPLSMSPVHLTPSMRVSSISWGRAGRGFHIGTYNQLHFWWIQQKRQKPSRQSVALQALTFSKMGVERSRDVLYRG